MGYNPITKYTKHLGIYPVCPGGMTAQMDHIDTYIKTHCGEVESLHVVGHSIGSWFTLEALRRNPDRVDSVVSGQTNDMI